MGIDPKLELYVFGYHFIDFDWQLNKKNLKFCLSFNHKGKTIGKALKAVIKKRGLEKIVAITVDNASSNDTAHEYLKNMVRKDNKSILSGDILHILCAAHIVDLIVTNSLKDVYKLVARVRSVVRFVRSSLARLEKFNVFVCVVGIECKKMLCLDVFTRWNSTLYHLEDDGNHLQVFVELFRLFYDVTCTIFEFLYVTSNEYCQQTFQVKEQLNELWFSANHTL